MFFSCGVIAKFVFCVAKMLFPQGVMRCQHSSKPETFRAVWRESTPGYLHFTEYWVRHLFLVNAVVSATKPPRSIIKGL